MTLSREINRVLTPFIPDIFLTFRPIMLFFQVVTFLPIFQLFLLDIPHVNVFKEP